MNTCTAYSMHALSSAIVIEKERRTVQRWEKGVRCGREGGADTFRGTKFRDFDE